MSYYIYSKYTWVSHLKDKKDITMTYAFQKILDESNRKWNKIWVDKSSHFYIRSRKSWLDSDDIKIDPTHNEWRSVVVEIFIKTFKNKTYKYMASISKNVYFDKLANIIKGAL